MDLGTLISTLPGGLPIVPAAGPTPAGVAITSITEDSRRVSAGTLFIARRGEKADGRAFIGAAISAGAAAVLTESGPLPAGCAGGGVPILTCDDVPLATAHLAERFYGDPSRRLTLLAATGTNGKTTTTFLMHQLLNAVGIRCGLMGTVVVDDGVSVTPAALTTAPAIEISRTMARMVEAGCLAASFEASSHALHQRRVGGLGIRCGVFTNLTHDHLDYHQTMEQYAAAKAVLFGMLPDAASGGVAVVNEDDPWHARMLQGCTARTVRCSMAATRPAHQPRPDWHAWIAAMRIGGMDVEIQTPCGSTVRIGLPLIGAFNVMNAMQAAAAVSACFPERLSPRAAAEALATIKAPPGRLEPVTPFDAPAAAFVDYAHTDDALERVMLTLREVLAGAGGGRLLCVFGCGGDRDNTKRPKMGKVAATLADRAFATSDNPRSENPETILDQILAGVPAERAGAVTRITDRAAAIHCAADELRPGDILLVAGKGHENYQIVSDGKGGTVKLDFDDRIEVARALGMNR